MIFNQKRIRNINRHLGHLPDGQRLRIVVDSTSDRLARVGFDAPAPGDAVLPNVVGPITRFNAEGRYVIHRDQPKEERYITTIEWSWEQWQPGGGTETVTDYKAIYRWCYPRTFISPPAIELAFIIAGGDSFIVSDEMVWSSDTAEAVQHAVNVFLELFGSCDVRSEDLNAVKAPPIRRVNWHLLPSGKYPWSAVRAHVEQAVGRRNSRYAGPVMWRHQVLGLLEPDAVYVGAGGFRDYVAFVFPERKLAILESTTGGNATYVFGDDWQAVSRLTKGEVLTAELHRERIIHGNDWEDRIRRWIRA